MCEPPLQTGSDLKKRLKKEAERVQREAEKQRRKLAEKMHRDQARAVMQKRNQMMHRTIDNDIEWRRLEPIRQSPVRNCNSGASATVGSSAGGVVSQGEMPTGNQDGRGMNERFSKARRREHDDDHSSSSDINSLSSMSTMSFATVDSDPGPSRIRDRPSIFGITRLTSTSSLRTSFDDYSPSARSSNSPSLGSQLANDFQMRASVNATHMAGSVSPPPLQMLSLSPSLGHLSPTDGHAPNTWNAANSHINPLFNVVSYI